MSRRRGFSLAEALVALAIAATVTALGAALVGAFATSSRTLPILGDRQASDARIESMIAELRNAVAIAQVSPTQVTAIVNTNGVPGGQVSVNGAPAGAYEVSYAFSTGQLLRAAGPPVPFVSASPAPAPPMPAVPPPPPAPTWAGPQPSCAQPCEDPASAVAVYFHVSQSGVRNVENPARCAHAQGSGGTWTCDPGYAFPDGVVLDQDEFAADEQNWAAWQTALQGWAQGQADYALAYHAYLGQIDAWDAAVAAAVGAGAGSALPPGAWAVPQWVPGNWQVVADGVTVVFAAYDAAGVQTTDPAAVATVGVTVQYPGQPAEEEQISLAGTGAVTAVQAAPLTIPPAPPDPANPTAVSDYESWCAAHPGVCGS